MRFRKTRPAIGPVLTAIIMAASTMQISAGENDSSFAADTNSIQNPRPDSIKDELSAPDIKNSDSTKAAETDSLFLGEIKKYPPMEISSKSKALELSIKLPGGMKFNHLTPFKIEMTSSKLKVIKPEKFKVTKGSAKLKLPITVNPGEAVVTVNLNFSYCGIKKPGLCYFKDVRLEIPIRVVKSADYNFTVKYEVFE